MENDEDAAKERSICGTGKDFGGPGKLYGQRSLNRWSLALLARTMAAVTEAMAAVAGAGNPDLFRATKNPPCGDFFVALNHVKNNYKKDVLSFFSLSNLWMAS